MKSVSFASTFETTTIADGDRYWNSPDVTTNDENIDLYASYHKYRGIFEFDVSAIPNNASISAANINLTVYRFYDFSPNTINFYGFSGDGIVTASDGNSQGVLLASVTYTSPLPLKGSTLSIALSVSDLQNIINNSTTEYLTIQAVLANDLGMVAFASLENTNGYAPASLSITYDQSPSPVPVPSTALLLVSSLGVLAGFGRRKEKQRHKQPVSMLFR